MMGEIRAHLLKHGRQTPRATGKGVETAGYYGL